MGLGCCWLKQVHGCEITQGSRNFPSSKERLSQSFCFTELMGYLKVNTLMGIHKFPTSAERNTVSNVHLKQRREDRKIEEGQS